MAEPSNFPHVDSWVRVCLSRDEAKAVGLRHDFQSAHDGMIQVCLSYRIPIPPADGVGRTAATIDLLYNGETYLLAVALLNADVRSRSSRLPGGF